MLVLAACANRVPQADPPLAVYSVLGADGQPIARAIVSAGNCPELVVDGTAVAMQTRAAAGAAPLRPKQDKAADFPVRVCEAKLAPGVHAASIGGRVLALPVANPQHIVVLGDTGCRIKMSEKALQDCSDAAAWPFRAVADAAAGEHPDLVVHVGDYHYRESACPADAGCASSPWGYGWDAWNADFFVPAQALLAAAPWVMARGNHEICSRAGQGWFRLLDPAVPDAQRRCDDPHQDAQADFTRPYAVPLGTGWQLIVYDSARASQPLDLTRPADAAAFAQYRSDMERVAALAARPGVRSIFVSHHPVLGFGLDRSRKPRFGTPALLEPMLAQVGPRYFPAGIDLTLHGHVHTFEAINFRSDHPAALVTGHGGDNLDADLPQDIDASYASAPGVRIDFVAHAARFGYLVLDRTSTGWRIRAQGVDGKVQARCTLAGARLDCPEHEALSRPSAVE